MLNDAATKAEARFGMTTWITVCDTCRVDGEQTEDETRAGTVLAGLIEAAADGASADGTGVRTRRVSCLMGCAHGCNVAIQAQGKLNYTLGRFTPDADTARAIVDYALLHADSPNGQVPYRTWPQGVKGHFVTRHPPLPET